MIIQLKQIRTLKNIVGGINLEQIQAIEEFHKKLTNEIKKANKNCNVTKYNLDNQSCLPDNYEIAMLHWQFTYRNLLDFYQSFVTNQRQKNDEL